MKYIVAILILTVISLTGCDNRVAPPSADEQEAILKDAPELFSSRDGRATLAGLEAFYLGQPKDEALEALKKLCPKVMEYRGGDLSQNAWFRGCVFREPKGSIVTVRVGFWPRLNDQVSTLEVKRTDVSLEAVRERFREFAGEVYFDIPRAGMVEMRAEKYQMFADIDEGKEGPTHITFGFSPKWGDQLEATASKSP